MQKAPDMVILGRLDQIVGPSRRGSGVTYNFYLLVGTFPILRTCVWQLDAALSTHSEQLQSAPPHEPSQTPVTSIKRQGSRLNPSQRVTQQVEYELRGSDFHQIITGYRDTETRNNRPLLSDEEKIILLRILIENKASLSGGSLSF